MKIYLTRHGQTEANQQGKFQGWSDAPLTALGVQAAEDLRDYLCNKQIDLIACSPLPRAKTTANIIKGTADWPIYYYENLKEFNMGDWEGRTLASLADLPLYNILFKEPSKFQAPNGENFSIFRKRLFGVIDELYQSYSDKQILIVAHGWVVRNLLNYFHNYDLDQLFTGPYVYGCSYSEIDYFGSGNANVIVECAVDHLSSDELKTR